MAEIAAAAVVVEETISTSAQLGVAAYMVSKPTMPLKATFRQIALPSNPHTSSALTRADHTLSIVGDRAYIFGGELADGSIATADVHVVNLKQDNESQEIYQTVTSTHDESEKTPQPRTKHAACAYGDCIAVYGGLDASGTLVDREPIIWLFNTVTSSWSNMRAKSDAQAPEGRHGARLFAYDGNLVLYGGHDSQGRDLQDVWMFDSMQQAWIRLPLAPVATASAAVADGVLYTIAGTDNVSSELHYLTLPNKDHLQDSQTISWQRFSFPTNPLVPGPRARIAAGLTHISTGHGRNYLTYMFGARQIKVPASSDEKPPAEEEAVNEDPLYWSDMWTCQLASSDHEAKLTSPLDAIKPAKIKDSIRHLFGADSGEHSWGEVEVLPTTDLSSDGGKVHPGPRGFFGYDHTPDKKKIVIWGGINAKGEKEGDGWIIDMQ